MMEARNPEIITRNQGEWNEIHAVMRILAEGRIATLRVTQDGVVPTGASVMVDSLRTGRSGDVLEYKLIRDEDGAPSRLLISTEEGFELASIPHEAVRADFAAFDRELNHAKTSSTFAVTGAEELFHCYRFGSGKSPSNLKQDCELVLIAPDGVREEQRGFSIKSYTGGNPTLFNASASAEFQIRLAGNVGEAAVKALARIPARQSRNWIIERTDALFDLHAFTTDVKTTKETFGKNLALLDSNMTVVIAHLMLYGRSSAVKSGSLREALDLLIKHDPLGLGTVYAPTYYSFRVRHFLRAAALGMTAAKCWNGNEDAEGGMLIVAPDRSLHCLLAGKREFEQYLLQTTFFDSPDTKRYPSFSTVDVTPEGVYWFRMILQLRERNPFPKSWTCSTFAPTLSFDSLS